MADLQSTFRRNLKSMRERLDLSQRKLSKECNYDKTYIGKIERGECIPSLESMNRLAEALDTSPIELLLDSERSVTASALVPLDGSLPGSLVEEYVDLLEDPPRQVLFLDLEGRVLQASDRFYD